jgi:hypothetical protein
MTAEILVLSKLTRSRSDEVVEILETNAKTGYIETKAIPTELELIPIVVRRALASHPFVATWQDEAKVTELAKEEEQATPSRKYTIYRPEDDGCLNQSDKMQDCSCSFAKFLTSAKKSKTAMYLLGVPDLKGKQGASPLERLPTEVDAPVFSRDLDERFFFHDLYTEAKKVRRNVFFNSGYCYTNLHFDTDANAYLCASGRRRWRLCHPDQGRFLTCDKIHANKSILRPTTGDFAKSPLAALVKFVEIELEPGDVLLVPSGWWHVVEGGVGQKPGSFSCGVNWFFEMPQTVTKTAPVASIPTLVREPKFVAENVLEQRLHALVDFALGDSIDSDKRRRLHEAIAEVGARYPETGSALKRRKL